MENKLFLALGLITIISGIGLVLMDHYVSGVCGSFVGLWLFMDNLKKIKAKNKQEIPK